MLTDNRKKNKTWTNFQMCNLLFISQNAEQHLLTLMFGYGNQIVSYFWFNFTIINVLAWKYIVHNKYNVMFVSRAFWICFFLYFFFQYNSTSFLSLNFILVWKVCFLLPAGIFLYSLFFHTRALVRTAIKTIWDSHLSHLRFIWFFKK